MEPTNRAIAEARAWAETWQRRATQLQQEQPYRWTFMFIIGFALGFLLAKV